MPVNSNKSNEKRLKALVELVRILLEWVVTRKLVDVPKEIYYMIALDAVGLQARYGWGHAPFVTCKGTLLPLPSF